MSHNIPAWSSDLLRRADALKRREHSAAEKEEVRKEEGKQQINCSSFVLLADVNPIFYAHFLHVPFFTTPFHPPSITNYSHPFDPPISQDCFN